MSKLLTHDELLRAFIRGDKLRKETWGHGIFIHSVHGEIFHSNGLRCKWPICFSDPWMLYEEPKLKTKFYRRPAIIQTLSSGKRILIKDALFYESREEFDSMYPNSEPLDNKWEVEEA